MLLRTPLNKPENQTNGSFLHVRKIGRQFLIGFMSALLNPKNAIFYLSLFTVMVSAETGLSTRVSYAMWMMSVVFIWDCCMVMVIGGDNVRGWLGKSIFYVEKVSGAALALFGIFLPFV